MSGKRKSDGRKARVYTGGKLVLERKVRGGPAPGYAGKRKATQAGNNVRRKAS